MQTLKNSLSLLVLIFFFTHLEAVPAYPYPKTITQPDGSTLQLVLKGDEFFHYQTTTDGIPLIKSQVGVFQYARIDATGQLVSLGIKAKEPTARSASEQALLQTYDHRADAQRVNGLMRVRRSQETKQINEPKRSPASGSMRSLVIMVNFSDVSFVVPTPNTAFTSMLNDENYSANGGTGSARDYFIDSSTGTFQPQFDVVGPYTLPKTMAYYGGNDASDSDKNPVQMIVDACKAASDNGVDFSLYDTDNDGYVDNVFVYYAGYNEAEWGPDDSVWPHRWAIYPTSIYNGGNYSGSLASITFNGKRLFDYACTSELRGNSGSNMAGIGTFVHEFCHVLGLPDLYATNGDNHHTLGSWSVMDVGSYANQGRTPPAMSAYERFSIGFLSPEILNATAEKTLQPLTTSNSAYLISSTGTHNLNGDSPSPAEFYMIENRQKTGWDSYLPGHGMLIYRIRYVADNWYYNSVNNTANAMGVDIIEADKKANTNTYAGDPFPGTGNVTSYGFELASGTPYYMNLSEITESGSQISFSFEREEHIVPSTATLHLNADVGSSSSANITVQTIHVSSLLNCSLGGSDAASFNLSGNTTLPTVGGTIYIDFLPQTEGMKNAVLYIASETHTDSVLLSGLASYPLLQPVVPETAETIELFEDGFKAVWNVVENANYYLIDVYSKEESVETDILHENFSLVANGSPNASAGSIDITSSLDILTQQQGWSGAKTYEAGGSLKLGSSTALGYLNTPTIDLSNNGGQFNLEFDAMAWNGDATTLKIFLNNSLVETAENLNNNNSYLFKSYSFTIDGGTDQSVIRFEGQKASRGRFFIDNIRIKQLVDPEVAAPGSPFTTVNTWYNVNNLPMPNSYYYKVRAVNNYKESIASNEVGPIEPVPSSVKTTNPFLLKPIYENGVLRFTATAGLPVAIFNLVGQKLYSGTSTAGETRIILHKESILLLRVGDEVMKLIVH